jgi:hypothetical protein
MDDVLHSRGPISRRLGGGQEHQLTRIPFKWVLKRIPAGIFRRGCAKEDIMTDTRDFVDEVTRKIEKRHDEIVKFRVIAEVADPDDQVTFYQIIEDIVEKENAVKEKLVAFDKSKAVDRTAMADEIERLQKRVEDAIEAARVRVN